MKLVRCENGHFFDIETFTVCQQCGAGTVVAPKSAVQTPVQPVAPQLQPEKKERRGLFGLGKKREKNAAPAPQPVVVPTPVVPETNVNIPPFNPNGAPAMPTPEMPVQTEPVVPTEAITATESVFDAAGDEKTVGLFDIPTVSEPAEDEKTVSLFVNEIPVTEPEVQVPVVEEVIPEVPVVEEVTPVVEVPVVEEVVPEIPVVEEPVAEEPSLEQEIQAASSDDGKTFGYFSLNRKPVEEPAPVEEAPVEAPVETSAEEPVEAPVEAPVSQPVSTALNPVTGWLVAVKGPHTGETFQIFAGRNSIGRNTSNMIILNKDGAVSREKHIWVLYEPKKKEFFLQPGESSGLTYLNDEIVMVPEKLAAYDKIELGTSLFVFIPLCGEKFDWVDFQ